MWIKNHYSREIVHYLRDKLRQLGADVRAYRGRSASAVTHLSRDSIYSIDNDNEAGGLHWFLQINSITRRPLPGPSPTIFIQLARAIIRESAYAGARVPIDRRSALKCIGTSDWKRLLRAEILYFASADL